MEQSAIVGAPTEAAKTPWSIGTALQFLRSKPQHARNLGSQLLSRLVAIGAFAVALPFFIHHHGTAAYGVLALLFSVYSFVVVLDFGVSYSVGLRLGRALARGNTRSSAIFAGAVPLSVAFAAIVFAAIWILATPISHALYGVGDYSAALRILGGAVSVFIISATPAAVVLVHHRVDWFNYSKLIVDIAKAGALLMGALSDSGIITAMWVLLAGTSLKCVVDFTLAHHLLGRWGRTSVKGGWSEVRTNLALGMPMAGASIVYIGMSNADRVIVSRLFGAEGLAHYSLAVDICGKAYFLVWAVTGALYPLIIRNAAARRDVSAFLKIAFASVALVAVFLYLPLALLAHRLLSWWLGPTVGAGASDITSLWCLVATIYLVMTVLYNQLQAEGRPLSLLGVNLLGLIILVIGVTFLPMRAGIMGLGGLMGVVFLVESAVLWILIGRARRGAA
jgi:O-antigen/teichoic acid export membrane protein